jgi:poly-gamma-glutamate synthesis protein (capsule biosynthesis protein)
VTRYDDTRESLTESELATDMTEGKILVPCEFKSVGLLDMQVSLAPATACVPVGQIADRVRGTAGSLGLLPASLVSASVKVLAIGGADLFGSPSKRSKTYPLQAQSDVAGSWDSFRIDDIRTLISTGDTCPDRGVSFMAVTNRKGWNWVLDGGAARYRGFKTSSWDWPVPILSRTGNLGQVSALISDNDVSANDFECPMLQGWAQHNFGMVFNIDPRVAPLLASKGGLKVVTLGSNHITDGGRTGVIQTLQILDAAGIKHTWAGRTLADALEPAVVDVRGIKFAFVGWDDISGSRAASATNPGVAPMTDDNVCSSIKAARAQADVVIAMPQWGWPEYHATITQAQRTQRQLFYDCGADGILGSGTHWASWVSIWPSADDVRFAIGSHGNFLFDQSWSRQTMEGVIVEATFSGKALVQFRLHPYVVVQGAQPCLLDPTKDGAYVLNQVWHVSDVR